jgi:predicted membrane channel-forming protein YqfA (hemolysin III family)
MTLLGDAQVRRGVLLMAVGSVLFAPALIPQTPPLLNWVLVVGAVLLTYGTWLVGTSEGSV